jgi:pilus assembly protein CpaC
MFVSRKAALAASIFIIGLVPVGFSAPAAAQVNVVSSGEVHAGQLDVPVNKSQVLRSDRPFAKALIGNAEIADVLPLTNSSLYVLGKKVGTTSLTLYDRSNMLIAVVDVAVGPDVTGLKRQLAELLPRDSVGARMANDSVILDGIVSSSLAADRAVQVAETYAPGKVVNMMSVGSAQQVMLEVRFSEIKRSALKQFGVGMFVGNDSGTLQGAIGGGAALTGSGPPTLGSIADSFGVLTKTFGAFGLNFDAALDALERKGAITTLAEPTLVALSGETASFLAGGEFPIPVAQGNSGGTSGEGTSNSITVEFKPFGVSLAFTPTVLADGVINMIVAPEVSSIDPTASIVVNGLRIPGLQTRRAKTTVELRDGESFALAGLLRKDFQDTVRQFPVLGSIPIIGALFRSTNFQREETELVIIVTPRLVRPVRAAAMKVPTDRAMPPSEAELFLLGKTDRAVGANPLNAANPSWPAPGRPIGEPGPPVVNAVPPGGGGMAVLDPSKLEKDYGHAL